MKILKRTYKNLMFLEAGFVWCLRKNITYDDFIEDVLMSPDFETHDGSEFDNLCTDLRLYRYSDGYVPITITDVEYDLCVDKFGTY